MSTGRDRQYSPRDQRNDGRRTPRRERNSTSGGGQYNNGRQLLQRERHNQDQRRQYTEQHRGRGGGGRGYRHDRHLHTPRQDLPDNIGHDTTDGVQPGQYSRGFKYWTRDDIHHLAASNAHDVIQRIQNEQNAFLNAYTFDKNYQNPSTLKKLIKILHIITNSQEPDISSRLLSQILECSGFMMKLKEFIQITPDVQYLQHLITVARFCIDKIPQSSVFKIPHAELKDAVSRLNKEDNRSLIRIFEEYNKQFEEKREEIIRARQEQQRPNIRRQERQVNEQVNPHDIEPPNDFREIEILPRPEEIQNCKEKPFLRPNIVKGAYRDWSHYLDVQFRLLREDFMDPLRKGIHGYLEGVERSHDIQVYENVRVLAPVCLYGGIGFQIQFDLIRSRLARVRWEHSRRLIYGSLLCLSNDHFRTIKFASVVKRDPELLQNGQLTVKFEGDVNAFEIDPTTNYLMVESTAYFEAYRHVLEGLQQVTVDQMPFRSYIVGGFKPDTHIRLPLCFQNNPHFDLNSVLELKRAKPPIDVTKWPSLPETCLDDSQLKALKKALSQEISIIQGPPGTGKTYIGLKIVQALLINRSVWDPNSNSPILVVCYTNHALDQFLDGIIECPIRGMQTPKVVRVGGRCKNDKIKECAMANLVAKMKMQREVPSRVYKESKDNRSAMKLLQQKIEGNMGAINAMEGKILTMEEVSEVMDHRHLEQMGYQFQHAPENKHMEVWLNLWLIPDGDGDEEPQDNVTQEDAQIEAALQASLQIKEVDLPVAGMGLEPPGGDQIGGIVMEDEDTLIEVPDEPQLLEEERMIEGESLLNEETETKSSESSQDLYEKVTKRGEWQVKQLTSKERKNRITKGLRNQPMTDREARQVVDISDLTIKQKWRLYQYWLHQYIRWSKAQLKQFGDYYDRCGQQCLQTDQELNKLTLVNAHVVGMTTTGAAKHSYILKHLHPKIVIVEEAAEVLESHIITSLCPSVQQLILIGDHKQLQPKLTCYDLQKKYNLHISLFERLAENGLPIATLGVQHRMRPEIASIVGNHIYDKLDNHESVYKYEHIRGIGKNMFFIEHSQPEKNNPTGDKRSHVNPFEAEYVVSLTRYLLKQGYHPSEITILTMYRGQLFEIKQKMRKDEFGGVRVAAVDDFQGEENEIVIVSLVRSNNEEKIGFLKIENRICVSLSRAKKGMYVIGNFSMLRGKDDTKWPAILEELDKNGYVGDGLPLCCQVHPKEKIIAKIPQDFSKSPEGGCQKQCGLRLECGHVCQSPCHPIDRDHKMMYRCQQLCNKRLPCGHKCNNKCYMCENGCPPCEINVSRILLCCHEVRMKCNEDSTKFLCYRPCERRIRCGHKCQNKCSQICTSMDACQKKISKSLPCGHVLSIPCSTPESLVSCPVPCKKQIESCSHTCKGTCGSCNQGRLHIKCSERCGRDLNCGHICKFPCPEYCPPCTEQCKNYCFHSQCPKKCYEPCVPCREPCKWQCRHFRCTATCGEMCNRPPCDVPCRKNLSCGHQCIGLCGEDCPSLCRICDKEEVCEIFFGTEDEEDACFIQLKDCKHIFEITGMDQWMSQQQEKEDSHIVKFIECPKCKTPIRRSLRYGNSIKKTIHDMEEVKRMKLKEVKMNAAELRRMANLVEKETRKHRFVQPVCKGICDHIDNVLVSAKPNVPPLLPHEANTIENKLILLPKIAKLFECLDVINTPSCQFLSCVVQTAPLAKQAVSLVDFLKAIYLSPQQINDAQCELRRLFCLARFCQLKYVAKKDKCAINSTDERELESWVLFYMQCGMKYRQATQEDQQNSDKILERIRRDYSIGGISESERLQIVKAMPGIQKGAWYKCPKGHIYCIGDCGGANQESKCPECGARIGGTGHRLVEGNVHAPEMDQSRHAAWSEGANLQNYDQAQLQRLFH